MPRPHLTAVASVAAAAVLVGGVLLNQPKNATMHFDISNWSQEQKNLLQATVSEKIYQAGITYQSISCSIDTGDCLVAGLSKKPSFTTQDLFDQEATDAAARDAAVPTAP